MSSLTSISAVCRAKVMLKTSSSFSMATNWSAIAWEQKFRALFTLQSLRNKKIYREEACPLLALTDDANSQGTSNRNHLQLVPAANSKRVMSQPLTCGVFLSCSFSLYLALYWRIFPLCSLMCCQDHDSSLLTMPVAITLLNAYFHLRKSDLGDQHECELIDTWWRNHEAFNQCSHPIGKTTRGRLTLGMQPSATAAKSAALN